MEENQNPTPSTEGTEEATNTEGGEASE